MRKLSPFRLWLRKLATCWMPETRFFGFKAASLRWCGATVGNNVRIASSAIFLGNSSLTIGDDVWIGMSNSISVSAPVKIGSYVDMDASITTGSHEIDPIGPHSAGKGKSMPVEIKDGVWLCHRSTVLAGVTIGTKSIVAAGAVVISDVPDRVVVAGVPAKVKKDING